MIWIIGFSIGGIALILSNLSQLNSSLLNNTKAVGILLCITIVFALLYRLTAYYFIIKARLTENFLTSYLSEEDIMPMVPEDLSTKSFEDMVEIITDDFGKGLNIPNPISNEQKSAHLNGL